MSDLIPIQPDIDVLIAALRSKDIAERRVARDTLIALGVPAAEALVEHLRDPFIRDSVMIILLEIGDPRPLVVALPDAPKHLRRHIRVVMSQLGEKSVPLLADLLRDGDADAKAAAIETLAVIDHRTAHELLLAVAAGPDDQQAMLAILALIDSGFSDDVMKRLLLLLQHPEEWIATRAFTTLLQLDDVGVVVLVSKMISDEREFLRSMAVRAIPRLVRDGYLPRQDGEDVIRMMLRDESMAVAYAATDTLRLLAAIPPDESG